VVTDGIGHPGKEAHLQAASSAPIQAERERLRRRYRPAQIRLLFIGESPPASGRFFYRRDSGLYRAIRDTFRMVDASITGDTFLDMFQTSGCYLIDLCAGPVDHLDASSRRAACLVGEQELTRNIRRFKPTAIVTLVKSIRDNVRRAAAQSGWQGPILVLPYPGRWASHRKVFIERLAPQLEQLFIER
jgi:hypothetical protein